MNDSIINLQTRREARELHGNNPLWKNYANRIPKNPFVQAYLMDKYKGICQYCGKPIRNNLTLHHKVYDKECVTSDTIRVPHPTEKRPMRTDKVPDCKNCNRFHECIDDAIYPVHQYCNMLIAERHLT